jgi:hypothetical protein
MELNELLLIFYIINDLFKNFKNKIFQMEVRGSQRAVAEIKIL